MTSGVNELNVSIEKMKLTGIKSYTIFYLINSICFIGFTQEQEC